MAILGSPLSQNLPYLCYAIMLPGRKSNFRAGFRPDSKRESVKIGPPGGLRPGGGQILMFSRLESGRKKRRKSHDKSRTDTRVLDQICFDVFWAVVDHNSLR